MMVLCILLAMLSLFLSLKLIYQRKLVQKVKKQIDFLIDRDTQTEIMVEKTDGTIQDLAASINHLLKKYRSMGQEIERSDTLFRDTITSLSHQAYVDALNFMVENANADYTPSDSLSTAATESQELFTNGKIAMQLNWSHQYPAAVAALGADKVGCAPMIAGSAGIGATTGPWYECVMKDSKNKEMAQKYVEFMYEHNEDYMDLTLKIAGRTSVYEEKGKEAGNEHTTAVLETLNSKQSQARPMVKTWPQIEEVLVGVVESTLDSSMLEAAKIDGANKLQQIFAIKLPVIKPVLLTALSVRIIDAARTFDIIWAMTEGGPNSSSETISIIIYKTLTRYNDIGYASAMAVVFIVVLVVFTLVFMQSLWNPKKKNG